MHRVGYQSGFILGQGRVYNKKIEVNGSMDLKKALLIYLSKDDYGQY